MAIPNLRCIPALSLAIGALMIVAGCTGQSLESTPVAGTSAFGNANSQVAPKEESSTATHQITPTEKTPGSTPQAATKQKAITTKSKPAATPVPSASADSKKSISPKDSADITIINLTEYRTDDIWTWIRLAESKMATRKSRIFAFIYPVGELIRPEMTVRSDYADNAFAKHEVLISQEQINSILGSAEQWFAKDPCIGDQEPLNDYRAWLEQGADASTMHGVCDNVRVVGMGVTKNMREREPLSAFQNFLIHEFYHAFQQDLEMGGECGRRRDLENSNTVWFVEGAAHYFATMVTSEINGESDSYNKILMNAYHGLQAEPGFDLWGGGPDIAGAAALRLMIRKGLLDEDPIMDASLFHNCARELRFDSASPEIRSVRNSWNLIEERDGSFSFSESALAN